MAASSTSEKKPSSGSEVFVSVLVRISSLHGGPGTWAIGSRSFPSRYFIRGRFTGRALSEPFPRCQSCGGSPDYVSATTSNRALKNFNAIMNNRERRITLSLPTKLRGCDCSERLTFYCVVNQRNNHQRYD